MPYYSTDRIRPHVSAWSQRRPIAEVLHGEMGGRFIAITIRVRGSIWICHPNPEGDTWKPTGKGWMNLRKEERGPSRRIRKAAKMALRRFLNP